MAYDGSGNYSLPPGSIVTDGTTIDAADHNTPVTDIAAALSQVLLRSGVAPMTGPLNMGGFTITNTTGFPTLSGANAWTGANTITTTSASIPLTLISTDAGTALGPGLDLYRNSATPAANDGLGAISFDGKNSSSARITYAFIDAFVITTNTGFEDGELRFGVVTDGTAVNELRLDGAALTPVTTNGLALGDATHQWSDAFFASGAVLNFNNGDVTITHEPNVLRIEGGTIVTGSPLMVQGFDLVAELQALRARVAALEAAAGV